MSQTTHGQLYDLITNASGGYDGSKILKIVDRLNKETCNGVYKESFWDILQEMDYSDAFRPVLTRFLKILKVVARVNNTWYVVPRNVAEYLLQPAFIKSAHDDLKQIWTRSNESKRLKQAVLRLKQELSEEVGVVKGLTTEIINQNKIIEGLELLFARKGEVKRK